MASPIGFEPTAPSLGNLCSIQLSYGDKPFYASDLAKIAGKACESVYA